MLEASIGKFTYDSANRLITADTRYYVYDVEGTRIKTQKGEDTTKFVYNVNARLSQLLIKTENNAETKYVYGLGLIGEEVSGSFKVYHFDYRGSTVAITNASGTVTDTFTYDTYGKLTARTGTTKTPFLYNGRDGVMYEEDTGLIYMRARYYSPILRRFVNADKVHGDITNALTLNRYSFCNGDPANGVDPEGLAWERGNDGYNQLTYEDLINHNFDASQLWFSTPEEAAFYFGYKYGKQSIYNNLEYGSMIYSRNVYEIDGRYYAINQLPKLQGKRLSDGSIFSVTDYLSVAQKTGAKKKLYYADYVNPCVGKETKKKGEFEIDIVPSPKIGKVAGYVHTHAYQTNEASEYFSDEGYTGDIPTANCYYDHGDSNLEYNKSGPKLGIKDFKAFLVTPGGRFLRYIPANGAKDITKDISELYQIENIGYVLYRQDNAK